VSGPFPGANPLILPELEVRAGPVALLSHPALPDVEVLPYVANRLVFAQIAAAAVAAQGRMVLVDLPARMSRQPGTLNLPLSLLPLLSVVIFPCAAGGLKLGVPVSPASPPAMAALAAREQGLVLRCIEPEFTFPATSAFHAPLPLPEDYRVYRSGLASHFASAWSALKARFAAADDDARLFAALRAASALRAARVGLRRPRLLVADWRLWWLMSRLLDGAIADPSNKVQALPSGLKAERPVLYLPDPGEAWRGGLLDDYPALVAGFHEHVSGATPANALKPAGNVLPLPQRMAWRRPVDPPAGAQAPAFDKRVRLDRLLVEVATSPDVPRGLIGTRRQLAFAEYLPRLAMGHAVPQAASHALLAARACGGAALASRLRRAILAYPRPPALPAPAGAQLKPSLENLTTGWGGRLVPHADGCEFEESHLRGEELLAAALEREGAMRELLGPPVGGAMFAVLPEYALHESLVRMAQRKAVGSFEAASHSRPRFVSLECGIDFQATLLSYARNPLGTVYVRHEASATALEVDQWTPVVFVLESAEVVNRSTIMPIMDANPAAHRVLRGLDPGSGQRDHVFTVMTSVRAARLGRDGHVKTESLAAIGWLFASRLMGPDRFALALARCSKLCRTDPDFEPEMKTWSRLEKLLGWALKYGSGRTIVVVSGRGFEAGPRVAAYAASRGIKIVGASLEGMPEVGVERLRRLLLVSSNFRNHPMRDRLLELLASGLGPL